MCKSKNENSMNKDERFNKLKEDMASCYDNVDSMIEIMDEYYLEIIDNLIDIQNNSLVDNYMIGMYNGMVLIKSCIDDKTPDFKDCIK